MDSWDKEVLPGLGLFRKHEGKGCHIQSEWKGIHLVGAPQASKEVVKGDLSGNSSRSISSRNTSLAGIMMTILRSSMS